MEFDETMAQHDTQWHGKARQIPDGRAVTICSLAVLSSAGTKWRWWNRIGSASFHLSMAELTSYHLVPPRNVDFLTTSFGLPHLTGPSLDFHWTSACLNALDISEPSICDTLSYSIHPWKRSSTVQPPCAFIMLKRSQRQVCHLLAQTCGFV